MNNKVKEQVAAFSKYARELLEEQQVQLKSAKEHHILSGKLARIKVFNEHLDILKDRLHNMVDAMLGSSRSLPPDQYTKLQQALKSISAEYINEYLCISFIKEAD